MRKSLFASLLLLLVATAGFAAPPNIVEMVDAVTAGALSMNDNTSASIDLSTVLDITPSAANPVVLKITVIDDLTSNTLDRLNVVESAVAGVTEDASTQAKTGLMVNEGQEFHVRVKKRYLHLYALDGPLNCSIVRVQ
jgi:hypothetical protein